LLKQLSKLVRSLLQLPIVGGPRQSRYRREDLAALGSLSLGADIEGSPKLLRFNSASMRFEQQNPARGRR